MCKVSPIKGKISKIVFIAFMRQYFIQNILNPFSPGEHNELVRGP